ncbi:MAG: exonuclease SbcCD subunit D [Bacteroidales bacterium]|nr:exonuclease SbcCD subunit D [Bacteroidales bacterium]
MKILHTADLHIGQILYQNYDRYDEHLHFFRQLTQWCKDECPDALLVSGDVFDIQQPSTTAKKLFNEQFVQLQKELPDMHIVITAGNHDSASRLHADRAVWTFSNTHLVGMAPSMTTDDSWQDDYYIELPTGFIITMPYMLGDRSQQLQSILDHVAQLNPNGKPVIMMGHLAVTGSDVTGHDFEIGTLKTQSVATLGTGYDYLALGHIHKPQTLGHPEDTMNFNAVTYPAPVARYSGSVLHVSCDETYPHSVSLVKIDHAGGEVRIQQLPIDQLRHFHVLPLDGSSFHSDIEALQAIRDLDDEGKECYFRLRIDRHTFLPDNFNQQVYDILAQSGNRLRYNPKHIWTGEDDTDEQRTKLVFEVAELQQMNNPMDFIEKTWEQYPDLDMDEVREAFVEVKEEIHRHEEAEKTTQLAKEAEKAAKKAKKTNQKQ